MKSEKPTSKERIEQVLNAVQIIQSFRNFIMHEYHAIDARVVWDTTRLVLPGFKNIIEEILVKEFN